MNTSIFKQSNQKDNGYARREPNNTAGFFMVQKYLNSNDKNQIKTTLFYPERDSIKKGHLKSLKDHEVTTTLIQK